MTAERKRRSISFLLALMADPLEVGVETFFFSCLRGSCFGIDILSFFFLG